MNVRMMDFFFARCACRLQTASAGKNRNRILTSARLEQLAVEDYIERAQVTRAAPRKWLLLAHYVMPLSAATGAQRTSYDASEFPVSVGRLCVRQLLVYELQIP
jgi:hypothetical protein